MAEHTPNRFVLTAMTGFFSAMVLSALLFWVLSLVWSGGISGLIASIGPGIIAVFGSLHIPAAIAGILLWQWRRRELPPVRRVILEAGTVYFILAVVFGMFMNYLLATIVETIT